MLGSHASSLTLPHLLSLPPLSVPGFITHPTPPPSISPSSLPSPGKALCSPLKVPTPPASSFSLKRTSLSSLAHYLSGVSALSPPPDFKRRKATPIKLTPASQPSPFPASLPSCSPPHSSSSEERGSPEGGVGGGRPGRYEK